MANNHKISVSIGPNSTLTCSESGGPTSDCRDFTTSYSAKKGHNFKWCSQDGTLDWNWKGDGDPTDGASPFGNDPKWNPNLKCSNPDSMVTHGKQAPRTWKYDLTLTTQSGDHITAITADPKLIVDNSKTLDDFLLPIIVAVAAILAGWAFFRWRQSRAKAA